MAKVKSDFDCPGCSKKNTVVFKKPGILHPSVVKFVCYSCGSGVMAIVKIRKPEAGTEREPGAISVDIKLTSIGEELAEKWRQRLEKEELERLDGLRESISAKMHLNEDLQTKDLTEEEQAYLLSTVMVDPKLAAELNVKLRLEAERIFSHKRSEQPLSADTQNP